MLSDMFLKCYIATIFLSVFLIPFFPDRQEDTEEDVEGLYLVLAVFLIPCIICPILDVVFQPLLDYLVYYFSPAPPNVDYNRWTPRPNN